MLLQRFRSCKVHWSTKVSAALNGLRHTNIFPFCICWPLRIWCIQSMTGKLRHSAHFFASELLLHLCLITAFRFTDRTFLGAPSLDPGNERVWSTLWVRSPQAFSSACYLTSVRREVLTVLPLGIRVFNCWVLLIKYVCIPVSVNFSFSEFLQSTFGKTTQKTELVNQ